MTMFNQTYNPKGRMVRALAIFHEKCALSGKILWVTFGTKVLSTPSTQFQKGTYRLRKTTVIADSGITPDMVKVPNPAASWFMYYNCLLQATGADFFYFLERMEKEADPNIYPLPDKFLFTQTKIIGNAVIVGPIDENGEYTDIPFHPVLELEYLQPYVNDHSRRFNEFWKPYV